MNTTKHKTVQVAELDKFIVYAYAPCYKYIRVLEPDYFIDTNTGENVGQELLLAILPDGTKELPHHQLFSTKANKFFDVTAEMIPDIDEN